MFSPLLEELIRNLGYLKGVGPKTAQRMALQILQRDRDKALELANTLQKSVAQIQHCQQCRTFSEAPLCKLCLNPKRNRHLLCVVETAADILAIEQTHSFQGQYFVLMGHLSPLDGIGPKELGIHLLLSRIQADEIEEMILATNATVEGEATAYYITEQIKSIPETLALKKITRLGIGLPLGAELGYLDSGTVAHSLNARLPFIKEESISDVQ